MFEITSVSITDVLVGFVVQDGVMVSVIVSIPILGVTVKVSV